MQGLTYIHMIAICGSVAAMLFGIYLTFDRLKSLNEGFSPNAIKALGVMIFLPVLVILAVLTNFGSETLAALLGTVAGYVLSSSESKDNKSDNNE